MPFAKKQDGMAGRLRNITGVESLAPELDAKRIQLIRELVPGLKTLGLLYDADDPGTPSHLSVAQSGAKTLSIGLVKLPLRSATDFDAPFSSAAPQRLDGLLIFTSVLTFTNFTRVAEFAHSQRLPTICEFAQLAEAGCLMSYGPTFAEFTERVAHQVDRILKGARPADLPFEQPTRYELVVNLKTAKAIGATIPQLILLRATRVIE